MKQFAVMIIGMILSWYMCKFIHMTGIFGMIAEFIISCIISVLVVLLFFHKTEEMKLLINRIKKIKAREENKMPDIRKRLSISYYKQNNKNTEK